MLMYLKFCLFYYIVGLKLFLKILKFDSHFVILKWEWDSEAGVLIEIQLL